MNFLLKIVEGPNKGAEVALVEGVAVTLGRRDDCDIILADQTLPDAPVKIEPSATGVKVDGAALAPFEVKTLGATSFAVGPADAPWGELVWPRKAEEAGEKPKEDTPVAEIPQEKAPESAPQEEKKEEKRHGGFLGCIVMLALLLVVLAALGWFFRDKIRETGVFKSISAPAEDESAETAAQPQVTLSTIAGKYGLSFSEEGDVPVISGNLKTRRERLQVIAEVYQLRPGTELDLSDDESFRASAEDALFNVTEGALKVAAATNRVLSVSGKVASPAALERMVRALAADLPKMRDIDVEGVAFSRAAASIESEGDAETEDGSGTLVAAVSAAPAQPSVPEIPVCGIMTVPYPYLVMRDGRRVMEGAAIGDSVILKIEADSVTLTNSMGRIVWKP